MTDFCRPQCFSLLLCTKVQISLYTLFYLTYDKLNTSKIIVFCGKLEQNIVVKALAATSSLLCTFMLSEQKYGGRRNRQAIYTVNMGGWTLLCKTEDKLCLLCWPLEFSLVSYKDRLELQKISTEASLDFFKNNS